MRLLLDTHLLLWWMTDDKKLAKKARVLIQQAEQVFVSSASIWEMVIKSQLGKLTVDIEQFVTAMQDEGFEELPIKVAHAVALTNLPNFHRDPFDRILVAQAISEPLQLLTSDSILKKYSELITVV